MKNLKANSIWFFKKCFLFAISYYFLVVINIAIVRFFIFIFLNYEDKSLSMIWSPDFEKHSDYFLKIHEQDLLWALTTLSSWAIIYALFCAFLITFYKEFSRLIKNTKRCIKLSVSIFIFSIYIICT